jgi:hypothetical protein
MLKSLTIIKPFFEQVFAIATLFDKFLLGRFDLAGEEICLHVDQGQEKVGVSFGVAEKARAID